MPRAIEKIHHRRKPTELVRVAAYARVSKESDRLKHSLSTQVSYYNQLIGSTPGWTFAGIYVDNGITGTSINSRKNFTTMIDDALDGNIDIILTKSISRFARNTVDLLNTVRALKAAGVSVRFERENIDTANAEGEVLLTLLASFAQAESESISQNAKWGIRKKYRDGRLHSRQPYGYHYHHGRLDIIEEEAVIVRRVFAEFLDGISPEKTCKQMNQEGLRSRGGGKFRASVTRDWLENPTYIGVAILQQNYRTHVGKSNTAKNNGELTKYIVEDSHPAIIDRSIFDAVQAELARRRASGGRGLTPTGGSSGLTHRITCTVCGRNYHRRTRRLAHSTYKYWWCETATKGKGNSCHAHQLHETALHVIIQRLLDLEEWNDQQVIERIERIEASPDWHLTIHLSNGNTATVDYRTGKEVQT